MKIGFRLIAGFLVWSSALTLLYAVFSVACALHWDASSMRLTLVGIWLAHVAACAVILWLDLRAPAPGSPADGRFILKVVRGSSLVALAATIWTGLPIVFTPPIC